MKQTNKLLSVLLALCLITGLLPWTVLPARADGDGTADSPWQIGTTGHESEVTAVLAGGVLTVSGSGDMADFKQVYSGGVSAPPRRGTRKMQASRRSPSTMTSRASARRRSTAART